MAFSLGALLKKIRAQGKEQKAMKGGITALLRDRVIDSYNTCQEKRYCPIYAIENIDSLYKHYSALGGNGTVTILVEELKAMPKTKKAYLDSQDGTE